MDLGLRGRACLVTGASRGIGLATALVLGAEGARVVVHGRDAAALERAAAGVTEAGGEVAVATGDLVDPGCPERLLAATREAFGDPDVLVNNAGTSAVRSLDELTDEEWAAQWELSVMAPMRLMRGACPAMARRGWGRVVNVCSSSGKRPSASNAAYSVAKAGQLSLSRAFADAYAGQGVCVNAVAPGAVASPLWTAPGGLADQQAAARGTGAPEALAAAAAKVPRGAMGSPGEIAAVIAFLCSEQAANVVGAAWSVDGGTIQSIV